MPGAARAGSSASRPRKPRSARPGIVAGDELARGDEVEAASRSRPVRRWSPAAGPGRCRAARSPRRRRPRGRSLRARAAAASASGCSTSTPTTVAANTAFPARRPSRSRPRRSTRRTASASSPIPAEKPKRRPLTRPSEIDRVRPASSASIARIAASAGSRGRPSACGKTLAPPPGTNPNGSLPGRAVDRLVVGAVAREDQQRVHTVAGGLRGKPQQRGPCPRSDERRRRRAERAPRSPRRPVSCSPRTSTGSRSGRPGSPANPRLRTAGSDFELM